MGLFGDLFGKAAEELVKNTLQNAIGNQPQRSAAPTPPPIQQPIQHPMQETAGSYWDVIPDEENLFRFSGSYQQYFSQIFTAEFPSYRVQFEQAKGRDAAIFTFWAGAQKALVVEVISSNSSAKKLRADCQRANIPYLRYYYGHWGWWNTRSYVVNRTRAALGLPV